MMYHYPRWIVIPSFVAVAFSIIGWGTRGLYQDAAFALSMAFLMGIVLQTQANFSDQIALVARDQRDMIKREIIRWGVPDEHGVELANDGEVHRVMVRPLVVPRKTYEPTATPPEMATATPPDGMPIPMPVVPVDTPERLADRLETARNTQETMKLTDEVVSLNRKLNEGGVPPSDPST